MTEIRPGLLLIIIIIGNMGLYWLFFGKKKFDEKMQKALSKNDNNDYIDLTTKSNQDLKIDTPIQKETNVSEIEKGTPADKNDQIQVGHKICYINEVEVLDSTSEKEVDNMLKNSGSSVWLVLKKGNIPYTHNYTNHHTSFYCYDHHFFSCCI